MQTFTRFIWACCCTLLSFPVFAQVDTLIIEGDTSTYTHQCDAIAENHCAGCSARYPEYRIESLFATGI